MLGDVAIGTRRRRDGIRQPCGIGRVSRETRSGARQHNTVVTVHDERRPVPLTDETDPLCFRAVGGTRAPNRSRSAWLLRRRNACLRARVCARETRRTRRTKRVADGTQGSRIVLWRSNAARKKKKKLSEKRETPQHYYDSVNARSVRRFGTRRSLTTRARANHRWLAAVPLWSITIIPTTLFLYFKIPNDSFQVYRYTFRRFGVDLNVSTLFVCESLIGVYSTRNISFRRRRKYECAVIMPFCKNYHLPSHFGCHLIGKTTYRKYLFAISFRFDSDRNRRRC